MFNQDKFNSTEFEPSTETVLVPALQDWFGEGETAEFLVRGLTAVEYQQCDEAAHKDRDLSDLLAAMANGNRKLAVSEARSALGLGDEVPGQISKRVAMLRVGTVSPPGLTRQTCVLIAQRFPVEFYELTNVITRLTGKGQQPKK